MGICILYSPIDDQAQTTGGRWWMVTGDWGIIGQLLLQTGDQKGVQFSELIKLFKSTSHFLDSARKI